MALRPIGFGFKPPAGPTATNRNDERRVMDRSAMQKAATVIEQRESVEHHIDKAETLQFTQQERADVQFDDKQLAAQELFATQKFACLVGYAGTGKTTTMKGVLPIVEKQVTRIDWGDFRTGGMEPNGVKLPAIALACFTNVAAKNLASKLPEHWAIHCMSIHSMLCYQPVGFGEEPGDGGEGKVRFEPRYHEGNKLPLDAIFIDEAGIVAGDLWEAVRCALSPHTRIYLLGDLAQLPAMYGASPLPFAMKQWPTVVLDTIYRQKGDNEIVPNLTRIRQGLPPIHSANDFRLDANTQLKLNVTDARRQISGYLSSLYKLGFWDPKQDIIITPQNDAMLGQKHWNGAFRIAFNPKQYDNNNKLLNPPILIQTAVGSVTLAVGDKVMATDNGGRTAREKRFNNGSIGIIISIRPNDAYTGSWEGLGEIGVEQTHDLRDMWNAIREAETGLENLEEDNAEHMEEESDDKKSRASSHIVTVVEQSTGDVYELSRSAEVATLSHAYAATAHKFQGSQARHVMVICHSSMPNGLNREWLYTACSRAQKKVFLMHEPNALIRACNNARLPGRTAFEKADALVRAYGSNKSWAIPRLPDPRKLGG